MALDYGLLKPARGRPPKNGYRDYLYEQRLQAFERALQASNPRRGTSIGLVMLSCPRCGSGMVEASPGGLDHFGQLGVGLVHECSCLSCGETWEV